MRAFGGLNFFRARAGVVADNITDETTVRLIGEWLPVYEFGDVGVGSPMKIPNTPFIVNVQPELMLRYDSIGGSNKVLPFSTKDEALRIGPEVTLLMRAQFVPPELEFLRSLNGKLTYHWSQDLYTGNRFSWLDAALIYNIDPNGFLALTGSYTHGNVEDTGSRTHLFKIGLTGKI